LWGGPGGFSAACRIQQLSNEAEQELTICVVEKGSEVGAHIIAGTVFEPTSLDELFPDWKERGAPLNTPVTRDDIYFLRGPENARKAPHLCAEEHAQPRQLHHKPGQPVPLAR